MNKGKHREEIYRELTPAGVGLCIITGAAAEAVTFLITGIRPGNVPVTVLVFLWGLFGILAAGFLFAADAAGERMREFLGWLRDMHVMSDKSTGQNYEERSCEKTCIQEEVSEGAQIVYGEFRNWESAFHISEEKKAS